MSSNFVDNVSIKVENLAKVYRLNAYQGSLREALEGQLKRWFSRNQRPDDSQELWALRDINFEVQKGESLGIVGPNGAGKTTILRILSRVTKPTRGYVHVKGRVGALLELGAGFHPDLTGRENIFLYGSILGLSHREITQKLDRVVDFSGLERFIDTPVKRYSSGMYVRLAFSVVAHTDPEVLLVDEVLAVGDAEFRQKCIHKINELRHNQVVIFFVSHNLFQVRAVCNRGLFLQDGQIQSIGTVDEAIGAYEDWMRNHYDVDKVWEETLHQDSVATGARGLQLLGVRVYSKNGDMKNKVNHDEPVEIRIDYFTRKLFQSIHFDVRVIRTDGLVCALLRSKDLGLSGGDLEGKGYLSITLQELQLTNGTYMVEVRIRDETDAVTFAEGQSPLFQVGGAGSFGDVVSAVFLPHIEEVKTVITSKEVVEGMTI